MERTAFSRAKALLNSLPKAKWAAWIAGAFAGVFYVLLVLLFALFVDLLDTRGRVPNFAQLAPVEQERFLETWHNLSAETRTEAIRHVGYGDFEPGAAAPLGSRPEDRARFESWIALNTAEGYPPVPGRMNADDLKKWGRTRTGEPASVLAMKEHELRWRAYVWLYLREHVSADAANAFQPSVAPGDPPPVPGLGEDNYRPHGILGLLVRTRGSVVGRLLNGVASFNHWMWESRSGDPNRSYSTGLLILALLTSAAAVGCTMVSNWNAARATLAAVTRLRRTIYHHALRLYEFQFRTPDDDLSQGIFVRQVEVVRESLTAWLTVAVRGTVQIILLLVLAALAQPLLALCLVLAGALVIVVGGHVLTILARPGRVSGRFAATRVALLLESLRMVRLVKAYSMELFNQSRVERQLAEYARARRAVYRGEAVGRPLVLFLTQAAVVTLLYLGGRMVLGDALAVSGLAIFFVTCVLIYLNVRNLQDLSRQLRRGGEAAVDIFEFLDRKDDHIPHPEAEFLQPMARSLEFRNVALTLPGEREPVLRDVSLVVRAGEKIAVMGADDDARRALLYLIPRFFDPTDGEVRVDGRGLKWVTPESLRAQVGIVMQGRLTFNDTVANNIGCGNPSISLPRIIEAAKIAHAHQFIQKLPFGYETQIGELGRALRPAEQFRIALARALARDPAIFIIEEPATPLDDDTKALLDDTFQRILPGKTVFFLPHRISTLKHCDRIVVLHDGKVEAVGVHRDLVHQSSLYKHLYYVQFNAFAEAS